MDQLEIGANYGNIGIEILRDGQPFAVVNRVQAKRLESLKVTPVKEDQKERQDEEIKILEESHSEALKYAQWLVAASNACGDVWIGNLQPGLLEKLMGERRFLRYVLRHLLGGNEEELKTNRQLGAAYLYPHLATEEAQRTINFMVRLCGHSETFEPIMPTDEEIEAINKEIEEFESTSNASG